MKLIILGATGPSGIELVKQGLERGHDVTAVVRNPDKLHGIISHKRLQVKKADVTSEEDLTQSFTGHDAILIALGSPKALPIFGRVTVHTDTIKPIASAMRANKIKRVIVISAWATAYTPRNPWFLEYFVKPVFIGRNLTNLGEMESYLEEKCQDLDYTVARAPYLGDGPVTDLKVTAVEDYVIPNVSDRIPIARADLARFMLDCLEQSKCMKKMVAVSTAAE